MYDSSTTTLRPLNQQIIGSNPPSVSFEFFPPKNEAMEQQLWESIRQLEPFNPTFVSVTYGAGGSTRQRTHNTVERIINETTLKPAAHLTCVGASKDEINDVAKSYRDIGVNHIVALRGDPPKGESYTPHENGYAYSSDLVQGLKEIHDFKISVAAFPEKHPEAISLKSDIDFLKTKFAAGADQAISQYFLDPQLYVDFLKATKNAGITKPILPGIIVIAGYKQLVNFSAMCHASIPDWVHQLLDGMDEQPPQRDIISAMIAVEQCRYLQANGINHFHFYTLNRPNLTATICRLLGRKET